MEAHPEDGDEEDRNDERRNRGADGREKHARVVKERVLFERADDSERDRKGKREQERADAELEGRADTLTDDLDDRSLSGEAQAKITADEIPHVGHELFRDRLVDLVVPVNSVDGGLGQRPVRVAIERTPGSCVREGERDERHEKHGGNDQQEPPDHVPKH